MKHDANSLEVSSEVTPIFDNNALINRGTYKVRKGSSEWSVKTCLCSDMYALIRRRAADKWLREAGLKLIRWITYVMPVWEYNKFFKKLKSTEKYNLHHTRIITVMNNNFITTVMKK